MLAFVQPLPSTPGDGAFAFARKPIRVVLASILSASRLAMDYLGHVVAAARLFHRQVLHEGDYLRRYYGQDYPDFRNRVRRYF
jgi:hypothetical protein